MPNVINLISKSNTKKLMNNQCSEPPKCNCTNKVNCPLKGKCQYECRVYKVEVHSHGSNNSRVGNNDIYIYKFYTRTV